MTGTVISPTGRNPRLLWTPAHQNRLLRMKTESHPWWLLTKTNAEKTGTSAQRYGDTGLWAAIAYQTTGDVSCANRALTIIRNQFANTAKKGANFTREVSAEYSLLYDWLYPAMSAADRESFVTMLNRWADEATTNPSNVAFPIRTADSDQTVGNYFQFAFLAVATKDDNPRAEEFLNRSYVGGLDASAADRATLRNAIRQYCEHLAAGGVWPEGTQYNNGTLQLLTLGVEGLRSAFPADRFPEVTALLPQFALGLIAQITPDLEQVFQWGDNEHPRSLTLQRYMTLLGMLQGALHDRDEGGKLGSFIDDLVAKYKATGYGTAEPGARLMLLYDPYASRDDWTSYAPFFTPGQGILLASEHDRGAAGSLFGAHFSPKQLFVDHQVKYFGDFQLYRRGEWVLTHPIGYGGVAGRGEGTNSVLLSGLSAMVERQVTGQESDSGDRYHYIAGVTKGPYYAPPYYHPPAPFVDEWARSLFYLPGQLRDEGATPDVLVVHDRVASVPITDLSRYRAADQSLIAAAEAPKQWILHAPIAPVVADNSLGWRTAAGQEVRVDMLLPAERVVQTIDEDQAWGDSYPNPIKSEQKWQLRIAPVADQHRVNFLNVIRVSDAPLEGPSASATFVASDGGELEGALISRLGEAAVLALFPAKGPGLSTKTLTVSFTVPPESSGVTKVYVADLWPDQIWRATVDGRPVNLEVKPGALTQLSVFGHGSHVLRLGSEATAVSFKIYAQNLQGQKMPFTWQGETRDSLERDTLESARVLAEAVAWANAGSGLTVIVEDLSASVRRLHMYSLQLAYRLEETPE